VSDAVRLPYSGAGDARTGGLSLGDRFRRHANALVRDRRSPLSAQLMFDAAADIDAGGVIAKLFADVPAPPGSVPQLRLLAALHYLVLAGRAPALEPFYPSAGGELSPAGVWAVTRRVVEEHFAWIERRLHRTVQTNEPGPLGGAVRGAAVADRSLRASDQAARDRRERWAQPDPGPLLLRRRG
jgi:hypothetical protein